MTDSCLSPRSKTLLKLEGKVHGTSVQAQLFGFSIGPGGFTGPTRPAQTIPAMWSSAVMEEDGGKRWSGSFKGLRKARSTGSMGANPSTDNFLGFVGLVEDRWRRQAQLFGFSIGPGGFTGPTRPAQTIPAMWSSAAMGEDGGKRWSGSFKGLRKARSTGSMGANPSAWRKTDDGDENATAEKKERRKALTPLVQARVKAAIPASAVIGTMKAAPVFHRPAIAPIRRIDTQYSKMKRFQSLHSLKEEIEPEELIPPMPAMPTFAPPTGIKDGKNDQTNMVMLSPTKKTATMMRSPSTNGAGMSQSDSLNSIIACYAGYAIPEWLRRDCETAMSNTSFASFGSLGSSYEGGDAFSLEGALMDVESDLHNTTILSASDSFDSIEAVDA
ncbi:hypothetical protein BT69DRAFT_1315066 [Atractiella rhizophila]|nr:hypothetical protein BT69DRAFT_1315066 [Atractiella rhizophila]